MRQMIPLDARSSGASRGKELPMLASCPLHLKRVCGVCTHFDGDLRGDGVCRKMAVALRGRADPGDCLFWERRSAR